MMGQAGRNREISRPVLPLLLAARMARLDLLLPYDKTGLINTIRENGRVDKEEYTPHGIEVKGSIDRKFLYIFTSYQQDKS